MSCLGLCPRRCHKRAEHLHQIGVEHDVIYRDLAIGKPILRESSVRRGAPIMEGDDPVEPGDHGVAFGHELLILGVLSFDHGTQGGDHRLDAGEIGSPHGSVHVVG